MWVDQRLAIVLQIIINRFINGYNTVMYVQIKIIVCSINRPVSCKLKHLINNDCATSGCHLEALNVQEPNVSSA